MSSHPDQETVEQALARKNADWAFAAAKRVARVRRQIEDRMAEEIEFILYDTKEQETRDALVRLARVLLDPPLPAR